MPEQSLNTSSGTFPTVAVLGGTGFIGRAVADELRHRGAVVRQLRAPRLDFPEWCRFDPSVAHSNAGPDVVERLAGDLLGADVIVNVAGIANPAAPATRGLFGANAFLPLLVARAAAAVEARRYVHVSSISVQPSGPLDETARTAPTSPYGRSRALGERLLLDEGGTGTVIYRPTSVHGRARSTTRSLIRIARSPVAAVAGDGCAPTPQVLVGDVATSIVHLALTSAAPPPIVIQPHNGMTTGLVLRLLSGREPRRLPERATKAAVAGLRAAARRSPGALAHVRRLEMMLFGRQQVTGWLAQQGVTPTLRPEEWEALAAGDVAAADRVGARR
jgi:nucleoside-diphosphate-sugar epimerase